MSQKKIKRRINPMAQLMLSEFESRIAVESRLKLPGVTGWLKAGIDDERMKRIKEEIENDNLKNPTPYFPPGRGY